MTLCRAQVSIAKDGGAPADACVNTWHFEMDPTVGAATPVLGALTTFYTSIQSIFSEKVDLPGCRVKWYNLADPMPRPPFAEGSLGLTGSTGNQIAPPELAICLSFQAKRAAGQKQSRRRGRVYLGPLGFPGFGVNESVPTVQLDQIKNAAAALLTASNAAAQWSWVVHSPTTGATSWALVEEGWVDDAFDVQRRRGIESTLRRNW